MYTYSGKAAAVKLLRRWGGHPHSNTVDGVIFAVVRCDPRAALRPLPSQPFVVIFFFAGRGAHRRKVNSASVQSNVMYEMYMVSRAVSHTLTTYEPTEFLSYV